MFNIIIRPLSKHLFRDIEAKGDLDWRQGYVATYDGSKEEHLVSHTDDSEVTLNLCLGEKFSGGELIFNGLRGEEQKHPLGRFSPRIGRAVLHAGRHLHAVNKVKEGNRFSLIIWSRSWNGIRENTCPCCWLNRRKDNLCICGKRWN